MREPKSKHQSFVTLTMQRPFCNKHNLELRQKYMSEWKEWSERWSKENDCACRIDETQPQRPE